MYNYFNILSCSIAKFPPDTLQKFSIFLEKLNFSNKNEILEFISLKGIKNEIKLSCLAAMSEDSSLGISLLKFMSANSDYIDKEALQEVFLLGSNIHNTLQLVAYFYPIEFNILLKFIDKHSSLFEGKTIKRLFLEKGRHAYEVSPLHSPTFQSSEGLKLLLKFLSQHLDLIDKQALQEILLRKTVYGNLLKLTVCHAIEPYNLEGVKILLKFLSEHSDQIDKKTIQQLFHQVKDLFELIALKPEVLKIVIKFLSEHPDWIDKKYLQRMFLKKGSLNKTAYSLSNQLEITKNFAELIIQHASFDQKTLKHIFSKKEPNLNLFIIEKVLEKYLKELELREENYIIHTTRFFKRNFGYSPQQKKTAALALQKLFKEPCLFNSDDFLDLKQSYPALSNGRLGQLFSYCESTIKLAFASEENASPIRNFSMT